MVALAVVVTVVVSVARGSKKQGYLTSRATLSSEKTYNFSILDLSFFLMIVVCAPFLLGSLAQSVEQLAFNQLVVRSSRTRPTTFLRTT